MIKFILLSRSAFIESGYPSGEQLTLTLLDRLNAAHSDFNIDLLWWLVLSSGAPFA
jgi:hypothetical protein